MLLYHFTFLRHRESIVAEGLRPSDDVVWLTTDSETFFACDQHGNPLPPEYRHNCRIKLVIPSHDRRLISWSRLLRKRKGPEEVEFYLRNPYLGPERARRTVQDWHCYLGTVPPDYFREIIEITALERADRR